MLKMMNKITLNSEELHIITSLCVFIGRKFDFAEFEKGIFYWDFLVQIDFKKKEAYICIDEKSPLLDNRLLYYAILGVCRGCNLKTLEFDFDEEGQASYL